MIAEQKKGVWLLQDGKRHHLLVPLRAIPLEQQKELENILLRIEGKKEK